MYWTYYDPRGRATITNRRASSSFHATRWNRGRVPARHNSTKAVKMANVDPSPKSRWTFHARRETPPVSTRLDRGVDHNETRHDRGRRTATSAEGHRHRFPGGNVWCERSRPSRVQRSRKSSRGAVQNVRTRTLLARQGTASRTAGQRLCSRQLIQHDSVTLAVRPRPGALFFFRFDRPRPTS